jgi:hypothetical protein
MVAASNCTITTVTPNPGNPPAKGIANGSGTWGVTPPDTFIAVYMWAENQAPPNTQSRAFANTNPNANPPSWDSTIQLAAGTYDFWAILTVMRNGTLVDINSTNGIKNIKVN